LSCTFAFKKFVLTFLVGPCGAELGSGGHKIAFGLQHVGGLAVQDRQSVGNAAMCAGQRETAIGCDITVGGNFGMENTMPYRLNLQLCSLFGRRHKNGRAGRLRHG
jgi:hypothetical protein